MVSHIQLSFVHLRIYNTFYISGKTAHRTRTNRSIKARHVTITIGSTVATAKNSETRPPKTSLFPNAKTSLSFRPYSMQGLPGVLWKLLFQIGVGQKQLPRIPSPAPLLQWPPPPPPPPIKTIWITCAVYLTLSPHERLAFTQLRGRLVHNMPYAV